MLKLRVVLSFAVATLVALTSLDGVMAQVVDEQPQTTEEPSYSGSGDVADAGHTIAPSNAPAADDAGYTPSPTKPKREASGSGSSSSPATIEFPDGDDVVPRWGNCDKKPKCAKGTFCKTIANGMSLCYPA
ncbi:unnamed protein product [Phytophthora lilii]|uniref:Unnamed protein product n=1 Tax=Phytophthora lilii TaxID=2077276 RepID=A0A9W6WP34_9STRA|nr:unnamed protein product [Phytophthora lilii]